jgi:hypothetical protein
MPVRTSVHMSLSGLRPVSLHISRLRLKCDGTCAETRFRLSTKRTSPFKSAGASVQSTTGNRGVRISVINAGYTMFRGSVKSTGNPFHSSVFPSLPLPCVTVYHHTSTGVYIQNYWRNLNWISYWRLLLKHVEKFQFWLRPDKIPLNINWGDCAKYFLGSKEIR